MEKQSLYNQIKKKRTNNNEYYNNLAKMRKQKSELENKPISKININIRAFEFTKISWYKGKLFQF